MLTLDQIPLDSDGIVRGSYRVRHKHFFNDSLCGVAFNGDLSEPSTGHQLRRLVGAMGHELAELIPADAEARKAMGVAEPVTAATATVPASAEVTGDPDPSPTSVEAETAAEPATEAPANAAPEGVEMVERPKKTTAARKLVR